MAAQRSSQSTTSTTTTSALSSSQPESHSFRITRSRAKANQRTQTQPATSSATAGAATDPPPGIDAQPTLSAGAPAEKPPSPPAAGLSTTPLQAPHVSHEANSAIRSITSADRSTAAHSPLHPSNVRDPRSWQPGVKSEDDDAPRPELDISSPLPSNLLQHQHQHQNQQHQQQYHPPQQDVGYQYHPQPQQQQQVFQDPNQFADAPYVQPGQPPSMTFHMQSATSYQAPYNPSPAPQPTFQRGLVDGPPALQNQHQPVQHHQHLHQHQHQQQSQAYQQFVYQHTSASQCECPSCGGPQMLSTPVAGPPDGAHALSWGAVEPLVVDGPTLGEQDWRGHRRAYESTFQDTKLPSWQAPPALEPQPQPQPQPQSTSHQPHFEAYPQQQQHHQHHQPMLQQQYNLPQQQHQHQSGPPVMPVGQGYQSYPQAAVQRWPNPQFDYGNQPPLYPLPPPPQLAGSSYSTTVGGPSHSPTTSTSGWTQQQSQQPQQQSIGPVPGSPVDLPPSPTSVKSDKGSGGVKHKSRKTWTEVEWKKLTDLADRSKRGDPHADIDWDFVTSGFGGRRCRQGILTVAAKRGLKVSTREARTIGKTRAKSPEDGDTMQS
ncbi:hypothetical protein FRB94_014041 [Tulasnella sp. JGI-2019a]|nr:hypothetical protein FRB94_014041 [Tulasnella sp. JGI-2019a]KAG9034941.1 hypothetical protein FRB95_012357 [Tulasnella sp. JGI-2019a]